MQGGGRCSHSIRKPTPPTQRQPEQALWWGKSNPERIRSPPRLFLQVRAGRRKCVSAVLLSVRSATGLTAKEKLGGERVSVVQRGRERMGGP